MCQLGKSVVLRYLVSAGVDMTAKEFPQMRFPFNPVDMCVKQTALRHADRTLPVESCKRKDCSSLSARELRLQTAWELISSSLGLQLASLFYRFGTCQPPHSHEPVT